MAYGTDLISLEIELQDTGERQFPFGESPRGRIALLPEGIMLTVLTSGDSSVPTTNEERSNAFKTIMAYSGRYEVDGDKFTTYVDVAWNGAWLNTTQARTYRVENDSLFITSAWVAHPVEHHRKMRGTLQWKRTEQAA